MLERGARLVSVADMDETIRMLAELDGIMGGLTNDDNEEGRWFDELRAVQDYLIELFEDSTLVETGDPQPGRELSQEDLDTHHYVRLMMNGEELAGNA